MAAVIPVAKKTFQEFSEDDCSMMASSLAYYTIFSLPPLLVIVVSIAGAFWGEDAVRGRVQEEMKGAVGEAGVVQLTTMLDAASKPKHGIVATVTGIIVLLFGATGVMVQLQAALNRAFDAKPTAKEGFIKGFIFKRLLSFAMILAIAFLLTVSLVMTTIVSMLGERLLAGLNSDISQGLLFAADFVTSLIVIGLLFTAMFKWMPDTQVAWRDAAVGGALTAFMFLVGKFLLGLYLGRQDATAYGPAASLVLILIWVYYSAMIFLLGAEFTRVWAKRHELATSEPRTARFSSNAPRPSGT